MNDNFAGYEPSAWSELLLFDQRNPLLFNTGMFLLLFVGFLLIYQAMRRWKNAKLIFVILFSLYFYYKSSASYCFILLGVCVSDFVIGRLLGRVRERSRLKSRGLVLLSILINIGMLVYFKYFNLLASTFANITNTHFDALDIILPAGISFFTFRSISYIVDIYRGQMEPADNFLEYTFFLTFFPPLLAGPVVRAKDMLPQIKQNPVATHAMVAEGIFLIIAGIVKKVIIADYISGNFVNRIFENPDLYTGFESLMAMFGFTLQIYCDFSGYSDMAIGIALLLGFRFKDNFNAPFKSQNPTEFWRRWHISLSMWLRDYVYIPLGGNRHGKFRTHVNKFVTMVVGGIWHGASWLYLTWGALQGALLVGHKLVKSLWYSPTKALPDHIAQRPMVDTLFRRLPNILLTMMFTMVGFTIFRFAIANEGANAISIDDALAGMTSMKNQILYNFQPQYIKEIVTGYKIVFILLVLGYVLHFIPGRVSTYIKELMKKMHPLILTIILALFIIVAIQFKSADVAPFIYMQY